MKQVPAEYSAFYVLQSVRTRHPPNDMLGTEPVFRTVGEKLRRASKAGRPSGEIQEYEKKGVF